MAGPADHTVRFARGAKPQEPRPQTFGRTVTSGGPRNDETCGGKWRNGMWARDVERRRHPRAEAKLRRAVSKSHGCRRDFDGPGQVAITAGADPVRRPERKRPRMTRAAASPTHATEQHRRREALKTAWASRPPGVGAEAGITPKRDGLELVTSSGTARPANVRGKQAKPHERRLPI